MNELALKDRLKNIAKEKKITFNEIWKQLLIERFLQRLSYSKYKNKFIFKGGMLLSQYLHIGRETMDIDFLIQKIKANEGIVRSAIEEIAKLDLNDNFYFDLDSLQSLSQPHMEYSGFRIIVKSKFGNMKDKIQIDIGVGDMVIPVEQNMTTFSYKGKNFFDGDIKLFVYPVENIFAEKLQTIVSKGAANSRMKDYHDVLLMIREAKLLDSDNLHKIITDTFIHRETDLNLPVYFDEVGLKSLQKLWSGHLKTVAGSKNQLNFPSNISELISELNLYLNQLKIKVKKI